MKRPVRFESLATGDLDRLRDFLDALSPNAAKKAARILRDGILSLSDFPDRGAAVGEGRRELYLPFGASGYVVQYRVDDDAVIVARIFHMREDR